MVGFVPPKLHSRGKARPVHPFMAQDAAEDCVYIVCVFCLGITFSLFFSSINIRTRRRAPAEQNLQVTSLSAANSMRAQTGSPDQ